MVVVIDDGILCRDLNIGDIIDDICDGVCIVEVSDDNGDENDVVCIGEVNGVNIDVVVVVVVVGGGGGGGGIGIAGL